MLKHDAQGFLVGDPVDLSDLVDRWKEIATDTKAIRSLVSKIAGALSVKSKPEPAARSQLTRATRKVAEPKARESEKIIRIIPDNRRQKQREEPKPFAQPNPTPKETVIRIVPEGSALASSAPLATAIPTARASEKKKSDVSTLTPAAENNHKKRPIRDQEPAVAPVRDARGRFIGKGGHKEGSGDAAFSNPLAGMALAQGIEKIADAVKGAGDDMGEADPAIAAMSEIAQPISRGFELIGGLGGDSKEEGLLRRIFRTLTLFRKDETAFNKAQNKTLEEIEENSAQGIGAAPQQSGFSLKGLLPSVGGLGATVLPALSTFAKRIPLLGGLIAGAGSLFDIWKNESDDSKTRAEKDAGTGKAVGKFGGAMGGMFAGAKLGAMAGTIAGPIGTALGTIVGGAAGMFFGDKAGSIIGEKIGGFVGYLRDADIPGQITSAWEGLTANIKSGWESALDTLSGIWEKGKDAVGEGLGQANNWIKERTGVDIGAKLQGVVDKITAEDSVFSRIGNVFKNNSAPEVPSRGEWWLGSTSNRFESGNRGAGTISTGKGDHGGASYGTYQLSSTQGSVQKFIKDAGYEEFFKGKKAGSKEFNRTWTNLAKYDPTFAAEQHSFVKREYYDKAQQGLQEKGIDLSRRGRSVQDALWSTSVQFGADGASNMFAKVLDGKNIEKLSDEEIVTALQDYKIQNNRKLFASSSGEVRRGTLNRAMAEKEQLVAMARADQAFKTAVRTPAVQSLQTAAVKAPEMPKLAATPAVSATLAADVPVGSSGAPKPVVVSLQGEVGQDVKDRGVAHIVTGGMTLDW